MAKGIFVTFDPYYGVNEYNSFKTAARNNGIEFEEYLRIRPPYNRFLKLKSKSDLPSFVNYDFALTGDIKWLVSTVKAVQPNEEYLLRRREGKDISYWNYILPKHMKEAHKEDYIMVFRSWDFTEMSQISKKLGDTKIFKWGKAGSKNFNIYYCYNPYIKGLIAEKDILMEFGKEATSGMKHEKSVPKVPGDLEYYLNRFVLIKDKLEDKTYEAEYWENGGITPLKRKTFIV